ncbi:hypothetical protein DFH08DRAFT_811061 [Mycena albidolilacea]|uniref:Uncharacterized protein n=1 Tax=Mycena albidolilacea TaxID=1033008 RepID=A0AAD7EP27_9AGAR|nr:hypothetical protein DFH08DRAFT_811061 [Mycena albidolilacea]
MFLLILLTVSRGVFFGFLLITFVTLLMPYGSELRLAWFWNQYSPTSFMSHPESHPEAEATGLHMPHSHPGKPPGPDTSHSPHSANDHCMSDTDESADNTTRHQQGNKSDEEESEEDTSRDREEDEEEHDDENDSGGDSEDKDNGVSQQVLNFRALEALARQASCFSDPCGSSISPLSSFPWRSLGRTSELASQNVL